MGSAAQRGGRRRSASWSRWWEQAVAPRLLILGALPLAGGGLVSTLLLVEVLLGVLPVAFVVATSVVIGRIPTTVTAGVGSAAWDGLVSAFIIAAATFVGQQLLAPVQAALGQLVTRRVDGHVHDRLIGISLRSAGIGPLEDQAVLDALKEATRELDRAWQTPGAACAGMLALVARYLQLAGYVVLVGVVASWPAAVVLLAATMVFRYGNRGGLRKYTQVWRRITPIVRRADYLREVAMRAGAAKELRVFGMTVWLGARYAAAYQRWLGQVWRERRRIYLYPYLGFTALGLAAGAIVLVVLARGGATGDVPLAELAIGLQATVAGLLLGQHFPESDVQTQFGMLAGSALERFEALVDAAEPTPPVRPAERVEPARPAVPPEPAGLPRRSVRFTGLSFSYPGGDRTVLDGLDLELPTGMCTAVVGVNGAGKTTLVKLLTRLYEPTAGSILVDGTDIREFDVAAWRRQVSVIFQDFVRYELSAADNIGFGAVHAPQDPQRVRHAASRAGILGVLERLPRDLRTPLARAYTDGVDLSGGQWQRIAIARSLYALDAGARVLVLDEPTAALDVRAEARFFDQFVELTRGATSLLISHRFSSVRRADRIVVLEGGRIVEQGSHDQLVAADGRYAGLFRLQAERFAAGLDAEGNRPDEQHPDGFDGVRGAAR